MGKIPTAHPSISSLSVILTITGDAAFRMASNSGFPPGSRYTRCFVHPVSQLMWTSRQVSGSLISSAKRREGIFCQKKQSRSAAAGSPPHVGFPLLAWQKQRQGLKYIWGMANHFRTSHYDCESEHSRRRWIIHAEEVSASSDFFFFLFT